MVEAVGSKPGAVSDRRIAPVARVAASPAATASALPSDAAPVATTARSLAAKPPVDSERVRRIKAAIADGSFPISPARIADRLIALRSEWMSDDAA